MDKRNKYSLELKCRLWKNTNRENTAIKNLPVNLTFQETLYVPGA